MQMKALEAIKAMVNPEEHAATALVDHHYYTKLGKQDLAKEARVDYDKAKAKGVKVTPEHIDSIHKFAKEQSSKMPKNPAIDKMSDEAHEAARKEVGMNKAMTASSMPRIPRALMNDTYRSATAVMTRDHSAIAKDMHTGPLTDEVIQELRTEEANRTRRQPVYKSCDGCGRTFMVKSMDDPCPTCSMRKSHYCSKCNSHLVKGRSGTTCPLCG
jgi:rubrerythrin